jgi:putative transcriptional regulator
LNIYRAAARARRLGQVVAADANEAITDSGLDNVYLLNGFTIHQTKYGQGVSIEDTDGLHRMIGRWLIDLPKPLTGAELRFLRLEMELSQARLAAILGSSEQNVRHWEKVRDQALQGPADRMVRALYNEYIGGDDSLRHMVDRLAELDQVQHPKAKLRHDKTDWELTDCSCEAT